jgi:hypothetical protein
LRYTTKWKYISKIIQMITKLDEIFNHILHMSSFSHFNSIWRVPFMWFHKKHLDEVFHSNKHKCVNTYKFVEKTLSFEKRQELCWRLCIKILFYAFIKTLDEMKENLPPKLYKIYPKKKHILAQNLPP